MTEIGGIKRDVSLGPERALVTPCGVAEYSNRLSERFCLYQQLIAGRGTTNDAKRLVASNRHLPSFLAGEIEDEDEMSHIFHVGDEERVSNDEPIAEWSVDVPD